MQKILLAIAAILVIIVGVYIVSSSLHAPAPVSMQPTPVASARYLCEESKAIIASYFSGPSTPGTSGVPPVPGGHVDLLLSDGRSVSLPQTISASGIRYANADASLVFWSKGDGAFVTENGEQTYRNCIAIAPDPGGLKQMYASGTRGFSIRYPDGFTVDPAYQYQALGPGKAIEGVSFTIPASMASGTNLAPDTRLSVEELPDAPDCSADLYLGQGLRGPVTSTIDGIEVSVASSTDAGVGNRYEEEVYAIPGTRPCIAIRYFIHSNVIENYPPGAVQAFDRQAVLDAFNAIRGTLIIQPVY